MKSSALLAAMALVGCAPSWQGPCETSADCRLRPASCCGPSCECGDYAYEDVVAIRVGSEVDYHAHACADRAWGCGLAIPLPGPLGLAAGCDRNRCVVRDIHTDPASACERDSDCAVATRPCGEWMVPYFDLAAYNPMHGSFDEFNPGETTCDAPVDVPPLSLRAWCELGHCRWWSPAIIGH